MGRIGNSWSGSTICYTGYNNADCSKTSSFIYRYMKLKSEGFFQQNEIDGIIVFGGTNDSWANAPLGKLKYSGWHEEDLFNVLPAISYFANILKKDFPNANLEKLFFEELTNKKEFSGKTFYKFKFHIKGKPKDTFLRTDNFQKGFAVLNGFNLGRYWKIGPQKTLYTPASILKEGINELIIFESDGVDGMPIVEFVDRADLG